MSARQLTEEEQAKVLEYRRAKRREYWRRKPPEVRAEKRRKAQSAFWGRMTAEERRQKRLEYDLNRAKKAAIKAAADTENAGT